MNRIEAICNLTIREDNNDVIQEGYNISSQIENSQRRTLSILNNTEDQEINLSEIGIIEYLWIESTQVINIKLNNNTSTSITGKFLLLSDTSLTKLYITNTSGNIANVKIIVGG